MIRIELAQGMNNLRKLIQMHSISPVISLLYLGIVIVAERSFCLYENTNIKSSKFDLKNPIYNLVGCR